MPSTKGTGREGQGNAHGQMQVQSHAQSQGPGQMQGLATALPKAQAPGRSGSRGLRSQIPEINSMHPAVAELLSISAKRGWMAYEELNNTIPDEVVAPEPIDELLCVCDRLRLELIDELEFRARLHRDSLARGEEPNHNALSRTPLGLTPGLTRPFRAMSVAGGERTEEAAALAKSPATGAPDGRPLTQAEQDVAEAEALDEVALARELEEAASEEGGAKRIDDPVRMYLTQMGSIPLLTRDEEIRLAKKIETTRMIFRRRCLESDYVVKQAVETLRQVNAGDLPFDRTMRISTAEANAKDKIARRIPKSPSNSPRASRTGQAAKRDSPAATCASSSRSPRSTATAAVVPRPHPGRQHRPDAAVDKYEYRAATSSRPTRRGGSARPSRGRSPTRRAPSASRST
jgi:hypothetical protein